MPSAPLADASGSNAASKSAGTLAQLFISFVSNTRFASAEPMLTTRETGASSQLRNMARALRDLGRRAMFPRSRVPNEAEPVFVAEWLRCPD